MRNYAGTRKGICSYNLVYNVLIQLLPLKIPFFLQHFSNSFQHRNEAFLKVVMTMRLFLSLSLLVIFNLPYSNIGMRKYIFNRVVIKIKSFFTRVALVSQSLSLVSGTRVVNQTRLLCFGFLKYLPSHALMDARGLMNDDVY